MLGAFRLCRRGGLALVGVKYAAYSSGFATALGRGFQLHLATLDLHGHAVATDHAIALGNNDTAGDGDGVAVGPVDGMVAANGLGGGHIVDVTLGFEALGRATAALVVGGRARARGRNHADFTGAQAGRGLQGFGVAAPDRQALTVDDLAFVGGDVHRGGRIGRQLRQGDPRSRTGQQGTGQKNRASEAQSAA